MNRYKLKEIVKLKEILNSETLLLLCMLSKETVNVCALRGASYPCSRAISQVSLPRE